MTETRYANAPNRTVDAGGTTFAYRELGPASGVPVIFLNHLAAVLDKAIHAWGVQPLSDLSTIRQPVFVANGDHDRMVPTVDLAKRLPNSELKIYPDAGHGGIFQFHEEFVTQALEFLARSAPQGNS